jgi:hypothetical protein
MRWRISPRGHDPRLVDLLAAIGLLVAVLAACRYLIANTETPPSTTALIEPSQTVHW